MSGDLEPGFWHEGRSYVDSAGWLKRWYEDGILRCTWHCIFANLGTVGPWRRWIRWWFITEQDCYMTCSEERMVIAEIPVSIQTRRWFHADPLS